MRGRDHLLFAAATTYIAIAGIQAATTGVNYASLLLPSAVAVAGSLAPDIDHPYSWASLRIPFTLLTFGTFILLMHWGLGLLPGPQLFDFRPAIAPYLGFAWVLVGIGVGLFALSLAAQTLGHRSYVHSLGVGAALTLAVLVGLAFSHQSLGLSFAFAWGWLSHLFLDLPGRAGPPHLLWPFDCAPEFASAVINQGIRQTQPPDDTLQTEMTAYDMLSKQARDDMRHAAVARAASTQAEAPSSVAAVQTATSVPTVCPKCGAPLVERTAKRGPRAGKRFLGCASWRATKCDFTFNLD